MEKSKSKKYIWIKRRLIIAKPDKTETGYSWTLAAALGEMLLKAEEFFGPRDKSYTILGIDFAPDGCKTWTPGNCGHIIIHLDMNCLVDRHDACFQLAHECVHLLSPTGKADANVLEEGIAVYFQQWYMNHIFGDGWWNGQITIPGYAQALSDVEKLLILDSDIVRRLRHLQPTIAYVTAEQIREICPAVPQKLAARLACKFVRYP